MKLISTNVGLPKEVPYRGQTISTGIFKQPVEGRVRLRTLNLDGDAQADLKVHGGASKAVYVYPAEHYAFWRGELPGTALPWGAFGENFTTEGLLEEAVRVGDRFRIGSAEIVATQPRIPCYKLGLKFGRADLVRRFLASRRTGFYCSVAQEGDVEAGEALELVHPASSAITVTDILRIYAFERDDLETLERAAHLPALAENWRTYFLEQIAHASR